MSYGQDVTNSVSGCRIDRTRPVSSFLFAALALRLTASAINPTLTRLMCSGAGGYRQSSQTCTPRLCRAVTLSWSLPPVYSDSWPAPPCTKSNLIKHWFGLCSVNPHRHDAPTRHDASMVLTAPTAFFRSQQLCDLTPGSGASPRAIAVSANSSVWAWRSREDSNFRPTV